MCAQPMHSLVLLIDEYDAPLTGCVGAVFSETAHAFTLWEKP